MIAKQISMRSVKRSSFGGLVAYLTDSQGKAERVGKVTVANCIAPTLEDAVLEVTNTQLLNTRSKADKCYHLVLSFPSGERVTPEVLQAVEREMVDAIGFAEHQRVSVVHHDTDHLHVHIAVNMVHPEKLTVHSPGWGQYALDRGCSRVEEKYGLRVDNHHCTDKGAKQTALRERLQGQGLLREIGEASSWAEVHRCVRRQDVVLRRGGQGLAFEAAKGITIKASGVDRGLSLSHLEKRLGVFEEAQSGRAPTSAPSAGKLPDLPSMEPAASKESFVGWVQREHSKALLAAPSWGELHAVAKAAGLSIAKKGAGLTVGDLSGHFCSASAVSRALSKASLQRRLGAFEPATTTGSVVTVGSQASAAPKGSAPKGAVGPVYEERDMVGATAGALYARYQSAQVERGWQLGAAKEEVLAQKGREVERVKAAAAKRREVGKTFFRSKKERVIWRAAAKQASMRDWKSVRERHQERLNAVQKQHGRQGWLAWLQQAGSAKDLEALVELRRRGARFAAARKSNVVGRATARVDAFLPGLSVDSVTKLGTVVYRLGDSALKDDGRSLSLSGKLDESAAAALLYGCRELHGAVVGVAGEKSFRQALVKAAVNFEINITFADAEMEAQRVNGMKVRDERQEGVGSIRREVAAGRWFSRVFGKLGGQRKPFKSNFEFAGGSRQGPVVAQSENHMPKLPAVDVVSHAQGQRSWWRAQGRKGGGRRGGGAGVLLPGETPGDVQQRPAASEGGVRRGNAGGVAQGNVARMLARDAVRSRRAEAQRSSRAVPRRGR